VVDAPIEMAVREQFKAQGGYFVSPADVEKLGKVVVTPQRTLNPAIVGRSVAVIAKMAGISVPPGTRCLLADVGGVGRDYPLSIEKLSPILAFYVEDGLERGAARCFEVLSYGGMGHTAGIHTASREAATQYGLEMPASRVCVNTPTTHGAIGFSTALPPSMTLGCGSWGGNVTSDNVGPLHLMDIKRVAFETRAVNSVRPAATTMAAASTGGVKPQAASPRTINREEITAIVDRFLANRAPEAAPPMPVAPSQAPQQAVVDVEAGTNYATANAAPQPAAAPTAIGGASSGPETATPVQSGPSGNGSTPAATGNGRKAVDFVCEDDVRRAIQKNEKIYVNARTIITPAARDMGEASEVFGKDRG
jgi:hypothetical protein